jgi:hypothetical protein
MKRREFFEKAALGSAAFASLSAITSGDSVAKGPESGSHDAQDHHHTQLSGPLSMAVVSFGQWKTDVPLDRHPNVPRSAAQQPSVVSVRSHDSGRRWRNVPHQRAARSPVRRDAAWRHRRR